jgi:RHS repeat-associated protein
VQVSSDIRYAGMFYHQDSGLYLTHYRAYDPRTGRWLSRDPLGEIAGTNLYAYVGGNPISYSDPLGLFEMDDVYGFVYDLTGWAPSQGAVDFWSGFGDALSGGGTNAVRDLLGINDVVNRCSPDYGVGDALGMVFDVAIGGAGGLRAGAAGLKGTVTKGSGKEFSHWIANRMGGPRSLWNGNNVSKEYHALSDPIRHQFMDPSWKKLNPMPHPVIQQWMRVPQVYKGTLGGRAIEWVNSANNSNCECP